MTTFSDINSLTEELKEYKKAISTIKEIINLFKNAEANYGGLNPPIKMEKGIGELATQKYKLSTSRVLVGHIEVEADFEIDTYYLNVHTLVINSRIHNDIRENLAQFLSVYYGQEYLLL